MPTIAALLVLLLFYIPLVFNKIEIGIIAIPLLGIANLLYLLSKSKNLVHLGLFIIPIVLFLLYSKFWIGVGREARDPLGMGGVAAGLMVYIALIGLVGFLEFFTVKQLIGDFPKFFSVFTNWRVNELKAWLTLMMLVPLAAHLVTVFLYIDARRNDSDIIQSRLVTADNRPLKFLNDRNFQYYNRSRGLLKEGTPAEAVRLKVGKIKVLFSPELPVRFYQNQRIQSGFLAEETAFPIQGRQIRFSVDDQIAFYPDGTVKEGALGELAIFELAKQGRRITLPVGAEVSFHEDGSLLSFYPGSEADWSTGSGSAIKNSDSQKLLLYQDGSLKSGHLAQDTIFTVNGQNIPCKVNEPVEFYPDGNLKRGVLLREMTLLLGGGRQAVLAPDTEVFFNGSGILIGIEYCGRQGYFFDSAGVRIATLANGSYLYDKTEFLLDNRENVYIRYVEPERNPDFYEYEENIKINAIGFIYGSGENKCAEILEQNNIALDPGDEDPKLFMMFKYSNPKKETIREILFLEPVSIYYRDKKIDCPPFQWVRLR